jgi:hypothetical protein
VARARLNRDEIVARVALLLQHEPRTPARRLANFAHLSAREFKHLLAGDVELADLVTSAAAAARSKALLPFDLRWRIERALLQIDRLGGPDSGWTDDMHAEFQSCP